MKLTFTSFGGKFSVFQCSFSLFNYEEELRNVNKWKNPLPLCIYADRSDFKQDE